MSASLLTRASLVLIVSLVGLLCQQVYWLVYENMHTQSINMSRLINSQIAMMESLRATCEMSHSKQKGMSKLGQKVAQMNAHNTVKGKV